MELSRNKGYDEKDSATSKDKNVLRVAIVSGIVEETRYETGYNIYDSRSCEAVAVISMLLGRDMVVNWPRLYPSLATKIMF